MQLPPTSTGGLLMVKKITALTLLLFFVILPSASAARVRLVVLDNFNWEHLAGSGLPGWEQLLREGALGLTNTNTASGRSSEAAAVSLAAGTRARGTGAGSVFHLEEPLEGGVAGEVYARRTGIIPPGASLVMPEIAALTEANKELAYRVEQGYLARVLDEAGRTIAVAANADCDGAFRPAAAIAADPSGVIERGVVDSRLYRDDPGWPFGRRSDPAAYITLLEQWQEIDLVVLDLGDGIRAERYLAKTLPEEQPQLQAQALAQLDIILSWLMEHMAPGDLLIVAGLQPNRELGRNEGKWLAPIALWRPEVQSGLLTSPSTRREGIVTNLDITATILDHFGLDVRAIHGLPMDTVTSSKPLDTLLAMETRMGRTYIYRTPLIQGYIAVIIILVAWSLATMAWPWFRHRLLPLFLLAALASPLVLLVLGTLPSLAFTALVWAVATILLALIVHRQPPARALMLVGAVTAIAVAADALLGAPLQQRSILGYDAIVGARYYGIGNEYMGVLLGSTLLATGSLLIRRKWIAAPIFAAVILLFMLPGIGANFGGTLAAVLGFGVALIDTRWFHSKKHRAIAGAVLLIGAALLIAVNLVGSQSHLGRFLAAVWQDPNQFVLAVQRKLAMNWRLVRWSLWSRAFAALFVGTLWLLVANRRQLAKYLGNLWPAVRGAMAAALGALVFNDSGVVAAATTLLYLTLPLLYWQFTARTEL